MGDGLGQHQAIGLAKGRLRVALDKFDPENIAKTVFRPEKPVLDKGPVPDFQANLPVLNHPGPLVYNVGIILHQQGQNGRGDPRQMQAGLPVFVQPGAGDAVELLVVRLETVVTEFIPHVKQNQDYAGDPQRQAQYVD